VNELDITSVFANLSSSRTLLIFSHEYQ
jgi:hypothetical protein